MPIAIGALAGLGQGLIGTTSLPANHKHIFTLYRGALIAAGTYGEVWGHWSPDVSYGLLSSGVALLAQRIPAVAQHGSGEFGYSAVVPPRTLLPDGRVPGDSNLLRIQGAGGCSSCAAKPAAATGCSSCGSGAVQPYAARSAAQRTGSIG